MSLPQPNPLFKPIALLAGALLLGSGAFLLAMEYRSDRKAEQIHAREDAQDARRQLQLVPDRLNLDRVQADAYQRLEQAGFLAGEDRVGWISSLALLRDELQLNRLAWRLSPRQDSPLGHGLAVSRMTLDLSPMNPAALARFLQRLQQEARGRVTVESCELLPDGGDAHCILLWWSRHEA